GLYNRATIRIRDHLGEVVAFGGVNRKLQLAVVDFELSRYRLALLLTGFEPVLEHELCLFQRASQSSDILVLSPRARAERAKDNHRCDHQKPLKRSRSHSPLKLLRDHAVPRTLAGAA